MVALSLATLLGASAASVAAPKSATFTVTAVNSSPQGQVTITSKVWITPTQARAEIKHPLQGDQIALVTNGFFYMLDPQSKQALKQPLPDKVRKAPDNFDLLFAKFAFDAPKQASAKKVRTESMSGYVCDVFADTVTKGEATSTLTVWVPQTMSPKFPVKAIRAEKFTKPGATMENNISVTLSNIKLGTAVPASTFAVPTGYKFITPPKQGAGKPATKRGKR
jgi:outer membrane lipoprotein-sorting protein